MIFPRRRPPRRAWLAAGLALAVLAGCAEAKKKPPAPAAAAASAAAAYAGREDVARFVAQTSERLGLDPQWMHKALAGARFQASVARLVMPPPPGTAKDWSAYRARFVEPRRIAAGAAFWRANSAWLDRAEASFGVPPEIVVGIIGVESLYGQQMGNFRAIDALATLAFDFPAGRKDRSEFFRDELAQLFVLCSGAQRERASCDPAELRSSYAGAIGMPQFMPGSINRYAVDFDRDGRIDLLRSAPDAIGSVASFLAAHGWQRGMATHYAVAVPVDASDRATLLGPDITPSFSAERFAELGAELDAAGKAHPGLLALVELQNGAAAPSYVAGTANFYALTRYNWSSYYALAVIDLGRAVAGELGAERR